MERKTYEEFEQAYNEFKKNLENSYTKSHDIAEFYQKWDHEIDIIIPEEEKEDLAKSETFKKMCELLRNIRELALDVALEEYYPIVKTKTKARNLYNYVEGLIDWHGINGQNGYGYNNPIEQFFNLLDQLA